MILFVWFGWLKWFFFYAKAFWFHVLFFTNTWDCLLLLESCSENIYLYLYMEEFYCCLFFPHSVDNLSSMGSLLCPGNYMHESQGLARRCFFFFFISFYSVSNGIHFLAIYLIIYYAKNLICISLNIMDGKILSWSEVEHIYVIFQ